MHGFNFVSSKECKCTRTHTNISTYAQREGSKSRLLILGGPLGWQKIEQREKSTRTEILCALIC